MEINYPDKSQLEDWSWDDKGECFMVNGSSNPQIYMNGLVMPENNAMLKVGLRPYIKVDFPVEKGKHYRFADYNWTAVENDILFCDSCITSREKMVANMYLDNWLELNKNQNIIPLN